MTKDLLIKFLNNSCSKEELEEVMRWAREDSSRNEGRQWVMEDWTTYDISEAPVDMEKFSKMLDKIHHKINVDASNRSSLKNQGKSASIILSWLTRAAAILLLPVLSILLYTISQNTSMSENDDSSVVDSLEIIAPFGSRTVVELTDGSQVHLNSGSRIKYPQQFSGGTRSVALSGEGYFKVANNPDKPFVVKAGTMIIKAIGTEFNVFAYPDADEIETTLVEGKVMLEKSMQNGEKKSIGMMVPNQHVSLNTKTGRINSSMGNVDRYIAWKDGKLVFENESITRVAEKLGRLFNVDIIINENIKDYTFTVTFVDEPLFQILNLMTLAAPVKYKVLPRKKLPDGSYSKQKIIIEKR